MAYEELSDDELDYLVHDFKGDEAAAINNDGREAQLAYQNGRAHGECLAATRPRLTVRLGGGGAAAAAREGTLRSHPPITLTSKYMSDGRRVPLPRRFQAVLKERAEHR
jgi:hypothetical protein